MEKSSVEYLKRIVFDKTCVDKAIKNGKEQELDELLIDHSEIMKCIDHCLYDELNNLVPEKKNQFLLGYLLQEAVGMWLQGKIVYLQGSQDQLITSANKIKKAVSINGKTYQAGA